MYSFRKRVQNITIEGYGNIKWKSPNMHAASFTDLYSTVLVR